MMKKLIKQYMTLRNIQMAIKGFIVINLMLFITSGITYGMVALSALLNLLLGQLNAFEPLFSQHFFLGVFTASAMSMIFYFWLASKGTLKQGKTGNEG